MSGLRSRLVILSAFALLGLSAGVLSATCTQDCVEASYFIDHDPELGLDHCTHWQAAQAEDAWTTQPDGGTLTTGGTGNKYRVLQANSGECENCQCNKDPFKMPQVCLSASGVFGSWHDTDIAECRQAGSQ